jgi:hypothetical protein
MASRGFAPALLLLVLLAASACGSSSGSTSRTSAPEELSSGRVDVGGYQLDWMRSPRLGLGDIPDMHV